MLRQASRYAPVTSSTTINVAEESADTPLGLSAPTDVDSGSLTITVTGLPTVGTITLANGTAVANNQVLTAAELAGLAGLASTIVVLMGVSNLPQITQGLMRHGLRAATPIAIVAASAVLWGVHFMVLRGVQQAATLNTIATVAKIAAPPPRANIQ